MTDMMVDAKDHPLCGKCRVTLDGADVTKRAIAIDVVAGYVELLILDENGSAIINYQRGEALREIKRGIVEITPHDAN